MNFFRTIGAAFAVFSRVPMPKIRWDEGSMRYMLCAFPLIGAVIGGLIIAWYYIAGALGFGAILYGAGLTLIPVAVTGGFHLDGFCDTSDALASHAPAEKKREILKDSHAGAFAVISLCCYFVLYFACAASAPRSLDAAILLGLAHMLTREASGLAALVFPGSGKGLLGTFRESAEKKRAAAVLLIEAVLTAAVMIVFFRLYGVLAVACCLACFFWLKIMAEKQFGGMSGDLSGWFLQVSELIMLLAVTVLSHVPA